MAKQDRDRTIGNAQPGGNDRGSQMERESESRREKADREQVRSSGSESERPRPQRQPGRLPLPD